MWALGATQPASYAYQRASPLVSYQVRVALTALNITGVARSTPSPAIRKFPPWDTTGWAWSVGPLVDRDVPTDGKSTCMGLDSH